MSVIRYICKSEIRLCSYTHISFLLFNIYISFSHSQNSVLEFEHAFLNYCYEYHEWLSPPAH